MRTSNSKVLFFLRLSIASVFLYAAIASFIDPINWIGYIPQVIRHMIPGTILLTGFSIYQLLLAVWLLSGVKTFYPAVLSALTLLGIIVANISLLDILFRDIAIFFAAVALIAGTYSKGELGIKNPHKEDGRQESGEKRSSE